LAQWVGSVGAASLAIQKCKVVQAWKTPEGQAADQVQALDTGEMMTIVTTGEATTLAGGIVAGHFNSAKGVMAAPGRDAPARCPQRVVVEADSALDVRDTDQNSGQASVHGTCPSLPHGLIHAT
jgi:hypothetical protein